ncbi:MAG: hypothetical protein WD827_00045 [Solirubrobacterales bacterium]
MSEGKQNRPPRGALAVIAVGLVATVAAAWLSTDKPLGAVELEWEEKAPIADSRPVAIPGGGQMKIVDAEIRAAEPNVSGYQLFRISSTLAIDANSAVGQGRVSCVIRVNKRTIATKTPKSRASFPRSSSGEDVAKQDVPEQVQVEFNSHGTEIATVELNDAFTRYTTIPGIVVSWPPYRVGLQEWQWGLPKGQPEDAVELGFASIWRTTVSPSAHIGCTVETAGGTATVRTEGALSG